MGSILLARCVFWRASPSSCVASLTHTLSHAHPQVLSSLIAAQMTAADPPQWCPGQPHHQDTEAAAAAAAAGAATAAAAMAWVDNYCTFVEVGGRACLGQGGWGFWHS